MLWGLRGESGEESPKTINEHEHTHKGKKGTTKSNRCKLLSIIYYTRERTAERARGKKMSSRRLPASKRTGPVGNYKGKHHRERTKEQIGGNFKVFIFGGLRFLQLLPGVGVVGMAKRRPGENKF